MQTKTVNLCLHNVVADRSKIKTIYDTSWQQVEDIASLLRSLRSSQEIDSYRVFFDDRYKSVLAVVENINFGISNEHVHIAVITDQIGAPDRLSAKDIASLAEKGFTVDSHGASHAALAIFQEKVIQPSPLGGSYRNMPYGKKNTLSTEEVRYQLAESDQVLTSMLRRHSASFVLPYGFYNKEVVYQVSHASYDRIYTCDVALDGGQFLAPRLLITQENINDIETIIKNLPMHPEYLI